MGLTVDPKPQTFRVRASTELSTDGKCLSEKPASGCLYVSLYSKVFLLNFVLHKEKHQQSLPSTNWVTTRNACPREQKDINSKRPNSVPCLKELTDHLAGKRDLCELLGQKSQSSTRRGQAMECSLSTPEEDKTNVSLRET